MSGKPKTIQSKDLKEFLNTTKRETRLMGALERHTLGRPFDERDQSYIHPSDVIKPEWCALAQYHALKDNYVETKDKITLRTRRIFDYGHAAHADWQRYINDMGNLYGKWKCVQCSVLFTALSPTTCVNSCPSPKFEYREVPLISEKHMIRGHADGLVKGLGDDFLIEIKTIGSGGLRMEAPAIMAQAEGDLDKAWRNVKTPFRSHLLQGQVYLHLAHLMVEEGLLESAPEEIIYIYELKANQDYKEFVVKYNPEFIEEIFDKALDVVWAVKNDRPPLCSINSEKGCKRCEPF